ncbi:MAG TPA: M55 family metallopeptidase [Thermoanaerobaculia bacterium]|jgi:D-amino peptidase
MRYANGFLAGLILLGAGASSAEPLRVYVSADMEGVAGVVAPEQLGPPGFEYERFRTFMTNEVLAAIDGARAAGATEFVVSDSHGNAENLLIEKFPKDVQIVRGFPRPLEMMEGIDGNFAAVLFVGYHASTTNPAGVRAHTMSSANLADVRIQGVSVPEAGFNAAIAGHFGVPVALITGDDVIVKEAQALLGPIEGVAVKQALGFHSAKTLTPEASCEAIREGARRAVGRLRDGSLKPYRVTAPVTVEVRFKNYRPAEVLAYLPVVERIDAHAVRYRAKDMLEASRFLSFVLGYEPGLSP